MPLHPTHRARRLWRAPRPTLDVHGFLDRQALQTSGPIRRAWLTLTLPLVRALRRWLLG